jgi:hypothetical protein
MKSHTIAERLMMPACTITVRTMIGKVAESEIEEVPVSDNTINRRVDDVPHDVEDVLSKNTNFPLQFDESTDITNKAQSLAFVRLGNKGEIVEFFCCYCKELPEKTKGQDIFNTLSPNLESCGLSWYRCVGICTVGALSMISAIKGFVTLVMMS